MRALADRLNDMAIPVLAVDGPTGIDLATGVSAGASVNAQTTVTFGGLRRGHLLAREDCGDLVVADIGHPGPDPAWPVLLTDLEAARIQGRFGTRDHKGDRGRIVVIGGDTGMTGALRMACRAAFGAGAGLVHAVAPADSIAAMVAAEPDVQTLSHALSGVIDAPLRQLVAGAEVLVIGPGLGKGEGRADFVLALAESARGVVLDADALNALVGRVPALRAAARDRAVILTPHPGEVRRLFPEIAGTAEFDPWSAAAAAAEASGCTVVLKGSPTVVAGAHGAITTIASGNPGLATGGSGDILSGLMGAMLAHIQQPVAAAAVAAQALGRAGDLAARRHTARAVRPMDVVSAIPDLWRAWEAARRLPPATSPPILFELPAPQRW
jgi:NAD(P)H-hydrate epimerase